MKKPKPLKGATDFPPIEMLAIEEKLACTEHNNRACPFCGGLVLSRYTSRMTEGVQWTQCDTCGATGPNTYPSAFGWNIRCDERGVSGPRKTLIDFLNPKDSPHAD